jgi:hypothetical protein
MQLSIMPEIPYVPVYRSIKDLKLYLFSLAFAVGNLLLPMTIHSIPNGGMIFLPLFFFTLVAAYSDGILTGILVAIASPLINYALTEMPPIVILPEILFKSLFLAALASIVAKRLQKINFIAICLIITAMQLFGGLFNYIILGNSILIIINSIKLGIPGMIIMAVGGYFLLRFIAKIRKKENTNL